MAYPEGPGFLAFIVPAVCDVLPARIRALRGIASKGSATRAGKMCRSKGVGMFRPKVCAQRNEPGRCGGRGAYRPGKACRTKKRKQSCKKT
jgi:hypothetical protein